MVARTLLRGMLIIATILMTGGIVKLREPGLQLTVVDDFVVGAGATLDIDISNWELNIGGSLQVINGGNLTVRSGATNAIWQAYGARVNVEKDILVGGGSVLATRSHPDIYIIRLQYFFSESSWVFFIIHADYIEPLGPMIYSV